MTSKQRRTKGNKKSYPILSGAELSALNRYIEHHGMVEASELIGISDSSLYRALQPGQGMRPGTIEAIREHVTKTATPAKTTNGSSGSVAFAFTIELTAADALALLRGCQSGQQTTEQFVDEAVRNALKPHQLYT